MLHVAFWESEVAKGPGKAASASKELQEVSDGGGARQKGVQVSFLYCLSSSAIFFFPFGMPGT